MSKTYKFKDQKKPYFVTFAIVRWIGRCRIVIVNTLTSGRLREKWVINVLEVSLTAMASTPGIVKN